MNGTLVALLAGVGIAAVVLVLAVRRRNPATLVVAATVTALSGAEAALLAAGHLLGVFAGALRRSATFTYDFRFYSLALVGFLLLVSGAVGVVAAFGLARRRVASWRSAAVSSLCLFAVNAPLAPIQGFAYLLAGLAAASLVLLATTRRSIESPG